MIFGSARLHVNAGEGNYLQNCEVYPKRNTNKAGIIAS